MRLNFACLLGTILLALAGKPAGAFELFLGATSDLRLPTSGSGGAGSDFGFSTSGSESSTPSNTRVRPTLFVAARQGLRDTGAMRFGLAGELHSVSGKVNYPEGFYVGAVHFTDPTQARLTGWDLSVGPYATWAPKPWMELEADLFVTHQRLKLKTDMGNWHMTDTLTRTFPQARLAASWRVAVPQLGDGREMRLRLDYTASRYDRAVNLALLAKVF
ncbi:hypothetical protein SAMN05877809_102632 [Rhodobacter sp. JA431]|uniref:hypothetical protein n=1 Tax=Rhodobacter sp. JA431 TaxID=570013 RepID=UPI000BC64FB4|nr:hypothetical protein [Rhodobacter sp. JA431]SOC00522.1 hypothetical protein SAMN05877809_102632 [Rhodobacter sp. JA431]